MKWFTGGQVSDETRHVTIQNGSRVFRKFRDGKLVLMLVFHVDDMAAAGEDDEIAELLKS